MCAQNTPIESETERVVDDDDDDDSVDAGVCVVNDSPPPPPPVSHAHHLPKLLPPPTAQSIQCPNDALEVFVYTQADTQTLAAKV